MERFPISKTQEGFHIEGFPEAVKVLRLTGHEAQRLADLALHKADLDFALECLDAVNEAVDEPSVFRRALWSSAIVHYSKCFGSSESRLSLHPKRIYKADPGASEAFAYFKSLRNKHVTHDENPLAQCLPGAVLNPKAAKYKIAKIVCLSVLGDTLNEANYGNLHLLATQARDWVASQFEAVCDRVAGELEGRAYDELFAMDAPSYAPPTADDVHEASPRV
jgi:hypothetical protein